MNRRVMKGREKRRVIKETEPERAEARLNEERKGRKSENDCHLKPE